MTRITKEELEKLYPSIEKNKEYILPEEFHKDILVIDPFDMFKGKEKNEVPNLRTP